MITCTKCAAIQGVDTCTVDVEINVSGQGDEPHISIIGLPDASIRESRERIWSAMSTNHFRIPPGNTTINLAPADLRKSGSAFDLAIALCLIAANNGFPGDELKESMIVGELALNGQVRPIPGILPMVLHARKLGLKRVLVPQPNAEEAAVIDGITVYGVGTLAEAVLFFREHRGIMPTKVDVEDIFRQHSAEPLDYSDVKGQESAKRALVIAAAGGHNILLIGSPGVGKSLLANRLPSILPQLTMPEALEVTKVHSIAGVLPSGASLIVRRPFRAPHHSVSDAGLLGGGKAIPRPGEISLAHRGVLFLDELPEFRHTALEALRQPLENGTICLSRAAGSYTFPAKIMLVAAMNPCPCGYYGHPNHRCSCSPIMVKAYRSRISGPLVDRLDLHIEVPPLSDAVLTGGHTGENSASMRKKVLAARAIQHERFKNSNIFDNASMSGKMLDEYCRLSPACRDFLLNAIHSLNMSARAYDRILRVSRTIADLAGAPDLREEHISEAMNYRCLDRENHYY